MRLSRALLASEWLLGLGGYLVVSLEVTLVLTTIFVGMDEPYQNFESVLISFSSEYWRAIAELWWFVAMPATALYIAVGILWNCKHPKPWRAPSRTAFEMLVPFSIWSACWIISQTHHWIGLREPAPSWFEWTVFSVVGSFPTLLILILVSIVLCTRRWLREVDATPNRMSVIQNLARIYHGE